MDVRGSPYVGVYSAGNEDVLFYPSMSTPEEARRLGEALGVGAEPLTIGGSTVLGSLMCLNSRGALVPSFIEEGELDILKGHLDVGLVEGRMNACGNNALASDRAAMVHPNVPAGMRKLMEDVLDVEVVSGTIAGLGIVGAAAAVTPSGVLCHPKVTAEEKDALEDLFGAEARIGTANYGAPLIGACLLANSKGCAVGTPTTGIELGRIEEALDLYTDKKQ
jgi:translation initiation factor 6